MSFNNKFGVPLTSTSGDINGLLQPKLKYKFRVLLSQFGLTGALNDISKNVSTVSRPSINYGETPIHSFNSVAYVLGKHEWQTIELVVRDDVNNAVAQQVGEQIQKQTDHLNQTSPNAGNEYKFDMQVSFLDGVGTPQETWTMKGCFLTAVSYDAGDYAANDPMQVTMTVRYDNAFHGRDTEGNMTFQGLQDLTPEQFSQITE